jgi:hypothetical protein
MDRSVDVRASIDESPNLRERNSPKKKKVPKVEEALSPT